MSRTYRLAHQQKSWECIKQEAKHTQEPIFVIVDDTSMIQSVRKQSLRHRQCIQYRELISTTHILKVNLDEPLKPTFVQ